jgi:hypothetical protein
MRSPASVPFVDEAKLLIACCLVNLNNIDVPYFYETIGSASIPGSLSHLLCVTDEQLMTIYQLYRFFNVKRIFFQHPISSFYRRFKCLDRLQDTRSLHLRFFPF